MTQRIRRGRSPHVVAACGVVLACAGALRSAACTTFETSQEDAGPEGASSDGAPDAAAADAATATSCRMLLAADPGVRARNAVYTVTGPDVGALKVYCDMTLDDGGWTLAGRSGTLLAAGASLFGWTSATGDVGDTQRPYSLNVLASGIAFSEVLVASTDGRRAYKVQLSSQFLATARTVTSSGTVTNVAGDCAPAKGPAMLRNAGAIERSDVFFFRDVASDDQVRGLLASGFELSFDDCERGGSLSGAQGMILVR